MNAESTLVIADLLRRRRRQAFVGRRAELEFFRSVLGAPRWPFHLLSVVGPAGIGKTALLREAAYLCEDAGVPSHWIDADLPVPGGLVGRVRRLVAAEADSGLARQVLFLDGAGDLAGETAAVWGPLLQVVPASWLLVVSSRDPMPAAWETDPAWRGLHRSLRLAPLSREESLVNLSQLQVPHRRQPQIADRAAGVPLVHSLAASYCTGAVNCCAAECSVHELVHALAGALADGAPTQVHRRALYAASLLIRTTEDLLGAMLDAGDAHGIHGWLARQGFASPGRMGLRLARPYRQALEEDLRWRNPSLHRDLVERGLGYALDRLRTTRSWRTAEEQLLLNAFYLRRRDPLPGLVFAWDPDEDLVSSPLEAGDRLHLVTMARAHEGVASARVLERWLDARPEAFVVCRDAGGLPRGFLLLPVFASEAELADCSFDPAIEVVARHAPFETAPGPLAVLRTWMASDTHQAPGPVQIRLFIAAARRLRDLDAPGPVVAAFHHSDPYQGILRALGFGVLAVTGDAGPTLYWRTSGGSVVERLLRLLERGTADALEAGQPPPVDLEPAAFERAVRQALRDYTAPDQLRHSPLLDTAVVRSRTGAGASWSERVEVLREEIVLAARTLAESPRRRKAYEAIQATYLEPEPTQEAAAEAVGMAFSTYRRYLGRGIRWLAELLRTRASG